MYSKINFQDCSNHHKTCDLTQQKFLLSQLVWRPEVSLVAECVLRRYKGKALDLSATTSVSGVLPKVQEGSCFVPFASHGSWESWLMAITLVSAHVHITFFPWVFVAFLLSISHGTEELPQFRMSSSCQPYLNSIYKNPQS